MVPSYGLFVPSVNVSKTVKEGLTLKLGYNRRIQRPGLQQLNPNVNTVNSQSISVGNPNLRPELTDNFELGVSTNIKKTYLNMSFFGRYTDNSITQVRQPSDSLKGVVVTTYQNIGKQQAYGTNVFMNVYILPNWTVNGSIEAFYAFLEGTTTGLNGLSETVKNQGLTLGGRLMTNITLKNGWGIQGWGGARGAQVQLQGRQGGFGMYSLGVKKDFKNKKGSIGLGAENFLTKSVGLMRTELTSPLFSQVSVNNVYNRGVRLSLNYKFGSMNFNAPKKSRSVKNDDVKDEGGGGDNGGGMPQGGGQQARPQGGAPQGKPQGTPQGQPQGAPQNKTQDAQGKPQGKPTEAPKKTTEAPKKD